MKNFKRILASFVMLISLLAITPVGVSAEWRRDNKGWWYTEGDSWVNGWKHIDGKWYYFYATGYMAQNTKIDSYILG